MALNFVAFNSEHERIFEAAIAGIPRVAELIAAIPPEQRATALNAAEQSYQKTAWDLGYEDAAAQHGLPSSSLDCGCSNYPRRKR
jgi:hypothetical protein